MGLIFYLSHQPRVMDGLPEIQGLDKLLHFLAYLALASSWLLAFIKNNISQVRMKTFLLGMAFAFSDEIHQTFIPTRTFELYDLVADGAGICFGIFVVLPLMQRLLIRL